MTGFPSWQIAAPLFCVLLTGCATMKESDTSRTGVEQLLISTATDKALAKVDFRPVAGARVFLESKYLDCTDKNYVIVAVHQRILATGATLVDKPEDADVVLELTSGAVGTDRTEWFIGVPQIPLPPPSPISIPRLALFSRTRLIGTAKLSMVAYDTKTKRPIMNVASALARSDLKKFDVLGTNSVQSGSLPEELYTATGEAESLAAGVRHRLAKTLPLPSRDGKTAPTGANMAAVYPPPPPTTAALAPPPPIQPNAGAATTGPALH
ncbi:MAG: hypothetical protein K2Y37_09905 [Pirellulales bacterium]|nr:hypothetical protein [Pirellulales bacterium]